MQIKFFKCIIAEALEAILLHSDGVESILNRKKVSRELLFSYLHWKKVTTDSNLDKKSLVNLVMDYWSEHQTPPRPCHQPSNVSTSQSSEVCSQVGSVDHFKVILFNASLLKYVTWRLCYVPKLILIVSLWPKN